MGAWYQTETTFLLGWVCHLLAACAIVYLLTRHALLLSKKLQPQALECGACTNALLDSTKGLCADPSSVLCPTASTQGMDIHESVVSLGTFGCMLFSLFYCCNAMVQQMSQSMMRWLPFGYCQPAFVVSTVFLLAARCSVYAVFTGRLHLGFMNSAVAYSMRLIVAMYAAIAIWGLSVATLSAVYIKAQPKRHCQSKAPMFLFAVSLPFDLFFSIFVVHLFSSALSNMLKNFTQYLDEKRRVEDRRKNADFYHLPLKYTVVTTVAIVSTMIAWMAFALTHAPFLVPLDCVLNCASLVLMDSRWKPVYVPLCKPLLKCVVKTPCLPCANLKQVEVVQLISKKQSLAPPTHSPRANSGTLA